MKRQHLVKEEPYRGEEVFSWDDITRSKFDFDTGDVELLQSGKILWRGDTAFTLESPGDNDDPPCE